MTTKDNEAKPIVGEMVLFHQGSNDNKIVLTSRMKKAPAVITEVNEDSVTLTVFITPERGNPPVLTAYEVKECKDVATGHSYWERITPLQVKRYKPAHYSPLMVGMRVPASVIVSFPGWWELSEIDMSDQRFWGLIKSRGETVISTGDRNLDDIIRSQRDADELNAAIVHCAKERGYDLVADPDSDCRQGRMRALSQRKGWLIPDWVPVSTLEGDWHMCVTGDAFESYLVSSAHIYDTDFPITDFNSDINVKCFNLAVQRYCSYLGFTVEMCDELGSDPTTASKLTIDGEPARATSAKAEMNEHQMIWDEVQAMHAYLDSVDAPRTDDNFEEYTVVGRIEKLLESKSNYMVPAFRYNFMIPTGKHFDWTFGLSKLLTKNNKANG